MAHPTRERLLRELNASIATAGELGRRLQISPSAVRYHLGVLIDTGCIERVEDADAPGRPRYRALRRALLWDDELAVLPPSVHIEIETSVIEALVADFVAAGEHGTRASREDRMLARARLRLDERAWAQLAAEMRTLLERVLAMEAEAAARLAAGESGGREIAAAVGLLQFPVPGVASDAR